MIVSLAEMKNYLRVDYDEDDSLITSLIETSEKICRDVIRAEADTDLSKCPNAKTAVMYASAYLYEHREEADYGSLVITLRAILFGQRKPVF